jgi:hypothetical protein
MKRTLIILATLLSLAPAVYAQQPAIKPPPRFAFTWADGVLAVGSFVDDHYSDGKREIYPLLRDSRGLYSRPRYVGYSLAFAGAFKGLEAFYREPGERRLIRYVEAAVGVTRFCIGFFHNRNIPKVRR